MTPQLFPLPQTQKNIKGATMPKALVEFDTVMQSASQKAIKRHWLEWAEYLSLGLSGLGTLAVAISGQAFYGVAPLTLTLSLNIANRYRWEQNLQLSQVIEIQELQQSLDKMERLSVAIITKLRQQISQELDVIRQQLQSLSQKENGDGIEMGEQLVSLGQSVSALQEIVASAITEVRQQVNEQLQVLSFPTSHDLEEIQDAIFQLKSSTEFLHETSVSQEHLEVLNEQFLQLQEELMKIQTDVQNLINQSPPNWLEIQEKLQTLENDNQTVVKPSLKRLITVVKQLQQSPHRH